MTGCAVSEALVAVTCWISTPLRQMAYLATPTLSVLAVQTRATVAFGCTVAARLVGAFGLVASMFTSTEAVLVLRLPAASNAWSW